jgi:hypothetical protein
VDDLMRFFEGSPYVDTPSVRHQLLRALRSQRQRWEGEEWLVLSGLRHDDDSDLAPEETAL